MLKENILSPGEGEYKGVDVYAGPPCHDPGCRGYGNLDSGVMFIGIAPAREEIKVGRPLVGPSGRMLNAVMEAVGLDRKKTYCTNLICWWKDNPTNDEAARCADRLDREIQQIRPKLIVLLGSIVTEIFTGRGFGKIRGAVQWNSKYNCYVMATYHPAAILRGMGAYSASKDDKSSIMIYDFVRDLKKIDAVLTWQPGAPESTVEYEVIDDSNTAQIILDTLPKGYDNPIALDVETTYKKDDEELDIFEVALLCLGVATVDCAYVFTRRALYTEFGEPALDWPEDLWWTFQNALFDTQVVKRLLGQWIDVKEDTMLQSYTLDERSGVHKLKSLAREYLGAGFWEEERFNKKRPLNKIPPEVYKDREALDNLIANDPVIKQEFEDLYKYNAHDCVYTARLCIKFRKWQDEEGVRGFYETLLIPAVNMYKEVQFHGVNLDRVLHNQFTIEWVQKYLDDETRLQEFARNEGWDGDINLNSPQQLSKFLFQILSLPIIKYTKTGGPSVDEEVIEQLRNLHPFVGELSDFRHLAKMVGTYVIGLIKHIKDDGRAHAVVKIHGSRTGRPAYVKPPLQTIPVTYAEDGVGTFNRLRELFKASDPTPLMVRDGDEYVIVESDFGKAEIWMAYAESGDKQLYADLTSGDYHTTVAMDVLNKKREQVTGEDRLKMKKVTFGIMYDREAPSLSEAINSTVIEAQNYINRFFKRNKDYAKWFRDTQNMLKETGELVTKTGRKRRIIILGNANRALKQAVNFPIQSTTSDVLLDSAIKVHEQFRNTPQLDAHVLFTVHDSIVCEMPRSKLEQGVKIIHDVMTGHHFDGVPPIPVEIKVGLNWGICKKWHDCEKEHCLY